MVFVAILSKPTAHPRTFSQLCHRMKLLYTAAFLLLATFEARPALAFSHDLERAAPGVHVAKARPLVHFLVAALHLPTQRALAVEVALAPRHQQVRTPEELTQRLTEVLLPTEYEQLLAMQSDATTYETLRQLTVR